ncbi:MAG TPA: hypothetical protein PLB89_16300 [Flavobacteriales bacterium]|nr:hypothetical protein [Flavobacteriales bacterium]
MRDELHLMELVDRYLDGSMSAEERAVFEQRAALNTELRQLIEDQRALREGLERVALRAMVTRSAPGGGMGWIGPVLGGALIIAIASYVWMGRPTEHADAITIVQEAEMDLPDEEEASAAPEKGTRQTIVQRDTVIRVDTIVRVDTQIRIVQVHVPADITDEQKEAIRKSIQTSGAMPPTEISELDEGRIVLQNELTPDGDGHNDRLIVPGGPYRSATMRIKDAKNVEIFSSTSSAPTWHGLLPDGSKAENGIYTIEVQATSLDSRYRWGKETVRLSWPEIRLDMQIKQVR